MPVICDIGGTNMRVATVVDGQVARVHKVATPKNPQEGIAAFVALAKECVQGKGIERVAGCVAGRVGDTGVISDARNLRAWEGVNIVDELSGALGVPVDIVNDAALVGLGEAYFGAGKGVRKMVYVTVSTGVGGALITDGVITASGGVAAIKVHGDELENLVSGTAVRKRFGIDPKDLTDPKIHDMLADELAEGLKEVVVRWSPDAIILGGSMIVGMNPISLTRTQDTLKRLLADDGMQCPALKPAELQDAGGLYGALARLTQQSL